MPDPADRLVPPPGFPTDDPGAGGALAALRPPRRPAAARPDRRRHPAGLALAGVLCLWSLGPGGGCGPVARGQGEAPAADEIVRRTIAQDEAMRSRRQAYEYDLTVRSERLDPAGKVVKTKVTRAVVRPTKDIQFTTDITPEPGMSAADRERLSRELRENQRVQARLNLEKLAPRYRFAVEGSARVGEHDCWILAYRPKPGVPAESREERIIGQLHGRLWIDKTTSSIIQSEGSLVAPVTVAVVASVNQLEFHYRSQPLPNGDVGPAAFQLNLAVRAPFVDYREHQSSTMTNYRPR